MNFRSQVSRKLDEEHLANLDLLAKIEQAFTRASRPGASRDADLPRLMAMLAQHIEHDIARHFAFEERELFPKLEAAGEGDLTGLLMEEHVAIREVATEVLPLAVAAGSGTLSDAGWDALKRGALEMVERLGAHINKETMALLPALDDLLDDEMDRELTFSYAAV